MLRVLVVGARRARQGIGAFVARSFIAEGAELCAVVGSSTATAEAARDDLAERGASTCRAYTDLELALASEGPDIACVCSPYALHREHLRAVANSTAHCLCEKPLWWSESADRAAETSRLVDRFVERGRYLGLVNQWPYTLPDFYRLYPHLQGRPVRSFGMHMGPISSGREMILDSAPHPLSVVQRLVGYGRVSHPRVKYFNDEGRELCLYFEYRHGKGTTEVTCRFTTTENAPRPASYSINGSRVVRRIELPQYDVSFEAEKRKVRIEDPLRRLVRDFLHQVATGAQTDRQGLIESVETLAALYAAA